MTRRLQMAIAALAISCLVPVMGQHAPAPKQHLVKPSVAPKQPAGESSRGEQVFHQNCARCHNAPQNFPPQISGTIVRHMRVRASLSVEDEKALLKFMNP